MAKSAFENGGREGSWKEKLEILKFHWKSLMDDLEYFCLKMAEEQFGER